MYTIFYTRTPNLIFFAKFESDQCIKRELTLHCQTATAHYAILYLLKRSLKSAIMSLFLTNWPLDFCMRLSKHFHYLDVFANLFIYFGNPHLHACVNIRMQQQVTLADWQVRLLEWRTHSHGAPTRRTSSPRYYTPTHNCDSGGFACRYTSVSAYYRNKGNCQ